MKYLTLLLMALTALSFAETKDPIDQLIDVLKADEQAYVAFLSGDLVGQATTEKDKALAECALKKVSTEGFRDVLYPVYRKYFTDEKALNVVSFYPPSLADKILSVARGETPPEALITLLTQEEIAAAERLGTLLNQSSAAQLNYEFNQAGVQYGKKLAQDCAKELAL